MSAGTKTLFLDFDGVLHPSICGPGDYFSRMPALELALRGASVGIVVSSSWRFHDSWTSILARFPKSLRSKLLGHTGEAMTGRHARWHEIQSYRMRHGVSDWRALDDSAFEFPEPCPELILCNGAVGLAVQQSRILEQWLAE